MLYDTLRVLGNSIPFDATLAMSRRPHQKDETLGYGFLSALEILYGHPSISLYIQKPDVFEKALTQPNKNDLNKCLFNMTYFERFCDGDNDISSYLEDVVKIKLKQEDIDQARGIDLRSMLERLIELE